MEKDKIFFSPENQGLTTTSANHIANLCKEAYMALEKELDEIQFVNSSVKLISSDSRNVLSEGITEVDSLQPKLLRIAQLKSLIAWLREAIKAKERLISEAKNLTFADLDIETPITPTMPT